MLLRSTYEGRASEKAGKKGRMLIVGKLRATTGFILIPLVIRSKDGMAVG
jgi:hypothetical protein